MSNIDILFEQLNNTIDSLYPMKEKGEISNDAYRQIATCIRNALMEYAESTNK
jgi:hypothetical protein